MTSAIESLGENLHGCPSHSPQRCKQAIQLIQDDHELTSDDEIEAFMLITRDTRLADTILSIESGSMRARYVRREIHVSQSATA